MQALDRSFNGFDFLLVHLHYELNKYQRAACLFQLALENRIFVEENWSDLV